MFMFERLHSKTGTADTYTFFCNLLKHYNSHVFGGVGGYTYTVSHSFCVSEVASKLQLLQHVSLPWWRLRLKYLAC